MENIRNYIALTLYEMFRPPLISFSPSINTDCEWDFPRALSGENHISYCKLINLLSARVGTRLKKKKKERSITPQPPINLIHPSASFTRSFPFELTPLMQQQQHRLWRECAFIAGAYVWQTSRLRHGKHTLHTEERNVHLMWSRLNLPGLHPDSLSRQLSMGMEGKAAEKRLRSIRP